MYIYRYIYIRPSLYCFLFNANCFSRNAGPVCVLNTRSNQIKWIRTNWFKGRSDEKIKTPLRLWPLGVFPRDNVT